MNADNIFKMLERIALLRVASKNIAVGDTEEYAFIEKAVEKATAKAVKGKTDAWVCPSCGSVQYGNNHHYYCPFCGQKLDWGKEE